MNYTFRKITEADNSDIATMVRDNLTQFGLDIPGTVYFDEGLDHLNEFYNSDDCQYYVIESDGKVIGGIGFAPLTWKDDSAELQKLYLMDTAKGSGIGYELINFIEDKMKAAGFKRSYLETHDNLQAAIHIYEKFGV